MPDQTDRIIFSPHQRFLALTPAPDRAKYRELMLRPDVQLAISLAFAELAGMGVSRDQLDGAQLFISILQNFSEPPAKPKVLTMKSLQAS